MRGGERGDGLFLFFCFLIAIIATFTLALRPSSSYILSPGWKLLSWGQNKGKMRTRGTGWGEAEDHAKLSEWVGKRSRREAGGEEELTNK